MSDENDYREITEYLSLKVDGETYGIDVTTIMEVIRVPEIAPVAGSKSDVLGIINLRGKIITILDARKKFNVNEADLSNESRIVIIQDDDNLIGLLVDGVIEVLKIAEEDIEQSPTISEKTASQMFDGIYSKNGQFVVIFNALKLIESEKED